MLEKEKSKVEEMENADLEIPKEKKRFKLKSNVRVNLENARRSQMSHKKQEATLLPKIKIGSELSER